MNIDFQRQRFTFPSYKNLATTGFLLAMLAVQMLAVTALAQTVPNIPGSNLAPVLNEELPNRIRDQYIVVFKPGSSRQDVLAAQERVAEIGGKVGHTYTSALVGFSATLPPDALQILSAFPGVAYIEADQKVSGDTIWTQPPTPMASPPTGLDRITQRLLPLDTLYTYDGMGAGVHVYVIDSGIRDTHMEFGGRASGAMDFVGDGVGTVGCHPHGTHVAGTIGGATFGIAKGVTLHAVRVLDCANAGTWANVIAGVEWVTNNAIHPAVANMSLSGGGSLAVDTAVTNSIASGVTYVVAAGNNNMDACGVSPARVPTAITVGATDATNDTRPTPPAYSPWWGVGGSNFGPCLDLFAPGHQILSAWNTTDTATNTISGTSMAAPHVAGVAARHLSSFPGKTPAQVWAQIDLMANLFGVTALWPGITDPGVGSPNKLLHWSAVNDASDDGDPHITTVNGIYYDFQDAGEFVALRDANGMEIQTRQTPVATAPWVSVNTAIAARVGKHRVTWQPDINGVPDPRGLQLRVDGVLTMLGANGLDLGSGGRIMKSIGDGIEINFPNGTALFATSNWWASQSQWFLNVRVFHTPATEGIMGIVEPNSWLLEQFADTWRVTDETSLFDYAPGVSTKTFTFPSFPQEKIPPAETKNLVLAKDVCRNIADENMQAGCFFDVAVTGDPIFAKSALISQRIQRGATKTTVSDNKHLTLVGKKVTFTATVAQHASGGEIPTGMVQFTLDGKKVGKLVELDKNGQAQWQMLRIKLGDQRVAAEYVPSEDSVFLPSSSFDENSTVEERQVPNVDIGAQN